jgi:hypothetical protein
MSVYAQQVKTKLTTMEGKPYAKADQVGICNTGTIKLHDTWVKMKQLNWRRVADDKWMEADGSTELSY